MYVHTLPSTIQQHKSNVGTQLTYLPGFTYMFTACVCTTPGTSTISNHGSYIFDFEDTDFGPI